MSHPFISCVNRRCIGETGNGWSEYRSVVSESARRVLVIGDVGPDTRRDHSRTICKPVRTPVWPSYGFPGSTAFVFPSKPPSNRCWIPTRARTNPMRLAESGRRKPGSASMKPGFASNFAISRRTDAPNSNCPPSPAAVQICTSAPFLFIAIGARNGRPTRGLRSRSVIILGAAGFR